MAHAKGERGQESDVGARRKRIEATCVRVLRGVGAFVEAVGTDMAPDSMEEYAPTLLAPTAEPKRKRAPPGAKEVLRALEAQANALERSRKLVSDQLQKLQVEEQMLSDLVEQERARDVEAGPGPSTTVQDLEKG